MYVSNCGFSNYNEQLPVRPYTSAVRKDRLLVELIESGQRLAVRMDNLLALPTTRVQVFEDF